MTNWNDLWRIAPAGLLLDENGDGLADGAAACIVPLTPDLFTPAVWAACANFAARIGLETPALRLPVAQTLSGVDDRHIPVFVSSLKFPRPIHETPWAGATLDTLHRVDGGYVAWLDLNGRRALWVEAGRPELLAALLDEMAGAPPSAAPAAENAGASAPQHELAPDLARLYTTEEGGLFAPGTDGFTPADTRVRITLGAQIDLATGCAAIDLAARIGLETAGATLPLAFAGDPGQASGSELVLALDGGAGSSALAAEGRVITLSAPAAAYLANVYPYLNGTALARGAEMETLAALAAGVRRISLGHPPAVKLALAQVQSGGSLPIDRRRAASPEVLARQVFRYEWGTPDGEDNVSRVRRLAEEIVLPYLARNTDRYVVDADESRDTLTFFCSAPLPARRKLATEIDAALSRGNHRVRLRVLPVHKAGVAWLQEEQLPLLEARGAAAVDLYFAEFRPPSEAAKWVDLPTRWLQEWFPAKELVQTALNLDAESVRLHCKPAADVPRCANGLLPAYRLVAYNAHGETIHEDDLFVLFDERPYLAGMPEYGLVHPSSAGAALRQAGGAPRAWHVPTDEQHFWDFYQQAILPALRSHVLEVSRGRPTPDNEPYFDRLEVEGYFGWPDEPLGIYEEFVSTSEALHEDIYFNTLDYLAALGESFCGRPISAAGQVLPLIHDYAGAQGEPLPTEAPRATVTLQAWQVPALVPGKGIVAGDRRDLPEPLRVEVSGIELDATGAAVKHAIASLHYANPIAAEFAGRILAQWRDIAGTHTGLPPGIEVELRCCAAGRVAGAVTLPPCEPGDDAPPESAPRADSLVIGPRQLETELAELEDLPGVTVWPVGRSYQGRTGYAVDVHLPLARGQTHASRLKLSLQKPTCLIVARHHANEVSSTTAAVDLIRDLATDPALRGWLAGVNLVFLPFANPDGAAAHYRLMAEHPRWKHHAARFNAAGMEIGIDLFNPHTAFGEARFRWEIWRRWLPDAIVDNHGVPSHEWCQPFAGYNSPPRFRVSYQVVQAMIYGIVTYAEDAARPFLRSAAGSLRSVVTQAVRSAAWLHERNRFWLERYDAYGHQWLPETSPKDVYDDMLFFYRGVDRGRDEVTWRSFSLRYPDITLLDWITEVPDETAQGDYLRECAEAHRIANLAMIRLAAESAQPAQRTVQARPDGRTHIAFARERRLDGTPVQPVAETTA